MSPRRRFWHGLYVPRYLAAAAVIVGWFGVLFAFRGHWLGIVLPLATTLLTLLALRRGELLSLRRRASLHSAFETAAARNRELERLGALAAAMLQDVDLQRMFQVVADSARDLLEAEGAMITLLVEEGRFLKVMATAGMLDAAQGHLLPGDSSLSGWAVHQDEAVVTTDLYADPRATRVPGLDGPVSTAAIVPLRSAGVAIGTIGVANRRDSGRSKPTTFSSSARWATRRSWRSTALAPSRRSGATSGS
jgi:uncharacterized protein YigA (DUF484 family)